MVKDSSVKKENLCKRQLNAINTKNKIIDSAKSLMTSKNCDLVSVDDITEKAGVAKGSFYTYFKTKMDVVYEVNKEDFFRLAEVVSKDKSKGLIERLEHYSYEFLKRIEIGGIEMCRTWTQSNLSPKHISEEMKRTKYEHDNNELISLLKIAIDDNLLDKNVPIKEIALYINAELYGLMVVWCMSDGKVIGSKVAKKFVRDVLAKYLKNYELT